MQPKFKQRKAANETRSQILTAAHKLFVAHGFAGTSISMIAHAAKINQSLIYHHFGNKENLWRIIKMEPVTQFQEMKGFNIPLLLAIEDAELFIEKLVEFRFELYDQNPDLRRIIDWQFLENDMPGLKGFSKETVLQLLNTIRKFQQQGHIVSDYDPKVILISLLNFPLTFFKGMDAIPKELATESAKKKNQLKQQFIQLSLACLKKGLIIS